MKTKKGYEPFNNFDRRTAIGAILKYLRQRNELSLGQLCQILDINKQTYANYEAGRCEPRIETLIVLANYYGVTMDFITGMSLYKNGIADLGQEFQILLGKLSADELVNNADRFNTLCNNMLFLSAASKTLLELSKNNPDLQNWIEDKYRKLIGLVSQHNQQ